MTGPLRHVKNVSSLCGSEVPFFECMSWGRCPLCPSGPLTHCRRCFLCHRYLIHTDHTACQVSCSPSEKEIQVCLVVSYNRAYNLIVEMMKRWGGAGTVSWLEVVNGPQFANSWLITPNLGIVFPYQVITENSLVRWRHSTAAVAKLKSMVIRGKPFTPVVSKVELGDISVRSRILLKKDSTSKG